MWLDLSTFTTLVSVEPKLTIETRNRVLKPLLYPRVVMLCV
ncbi:hypothetical protein OROMI_003777 [Orobanche minor]